MADMTVADLVCVHMALRSITNSYTL